ncbi:MAG: SDR family NAD(P)-dependent oxidoreductase [Actinomycetia bacterium]|nr:SDR family NAD(P)-dependent oxidoreductase [Actinomycetes bacterium]
MDVAGKVAVVTGSAGGIGAALAQRLVEHGARVVLTDLDAARLEATAAALRATQPAGSVVAHAGDVTQDEHIAATLRIARESFGPVGLYFANAGVGGGVGLEASEAEWHHALEVNVLAHVRAARRLVPEWLERGEGYFVSTASAAGLLTQIGSATYAVSKHGAVAFAEWLAVTYGARGIRVSCLAPMGVDTAMLRAGADSADPVSRRSARAVIEAGRVLVPLEVADLVLAAVLEERFLILPHPEVLEFFRRKASDYDRWIRGMQRYQESLA